MARELRIGDRVRTKRGDGIVTQLCFNQSAYVMLANGDIWLSHNVELLPADISRARVKAYQAELVERAASLRAFSVPSMPGGDLSSHAAEVQRIADELAAMLTEVDHA